jgi:phage terminase large subunit GpA-like protein
MDAINDPAVEEIVVMCSAQVGKTEIANNTVGYFMDQDPSPILLLQPTLDMAETYSKDRLAPMLRDTPCLQGKVKDARSRDSGNTLLHKTFPGGHLTMSGANSPASLASRPIRIVICDEVDRYPTSAGTEGDPVDLARKRTTTFWNRKILLTSTPTVAGLSRIEAAFEATDKRRFFVPCLACGEFQTLVWSQILWDPGKPDTARYKCAHCPSRWGDAARWRAVRNGKWRATAPFAGIAGFHIWEAYSSWVKLATIVEAFFKAKDFPERFKTWVNTSLGETWQEKGEAPDWQRLYERSRGAPYKQGTVPRGAVFLTAGVDVQKNRLECQVVGWGRGKQSWLVDYVVFEGDTSRSEVWLQLTQFAGSMYRHESGLEMGIARLAIDSGFATQEVYAWARQQAPGRILVVKGYEQGSVPIGQPSTVDVNYAGKRIANGMRVWPVSTSILKSELYGWLRLDAPKEGEPVPGGFCHFPELNEEFFQQLTAEQWMTRVVKGFRKGEWVKMRERNEGLDTRIYARAAASVVGLDRYTESAWDALEQQFAGAEPSSPSSSSTPAHPPSAPSAPPSPSSGGQRGNGGWLNRGGRPWLGRR